jgi:hypothetical protein
MAVALVINWVTMKIISTSTNTDTSNSASVNAWHPFVAFGTWIGVLEHISRISERCSHGAVRRSGDRLPRISVTTADGFAIIG